MGSAKLKDAMLALLFCMPIHGYSEELCEIVRDAKIVAQDDANTYLGEISNSFGSDSIFNEFGTYGNEFNSKSIWNEFGTFGSEFSNESPFNKFTSSPPMIIKDRKIIGYLSSNKSIQGALPPNLLKALCEDDL